MVPWLWIDPEGRLYLDNNRTGANAIPWDDVYDKLTTVNPWTRTPMELAAKYFPGMKAEFNEQTQWLALTEG